VDAVTLAERITRLKIEDQVGGMGYVASLPDKTPSAGNVLHYLAIIREKWLLRRTIAKASAWHRRNGES
jgi:replicative DNA helicase